MPSCLTIGAPTGADDRRALQVAFDAGRDGLYRYLIVRAGQDVHLADDLMQQLWVQAASARLIPPAEQIEFWLRAIARNLIRAHWRKRGRRPAHVPLADPRLSARLADQLVLQEWAPELLEQREVSDQLLLALTELSGPQQLLLIEHYFHDVTHVELARQLDTSPRAIEGRLYRARLALRQRLAHLDPDDASGDGGGVTP